MEAASPLDGSLGHRLEVARARRDPVAVANDLAVLVAHEHRRADEERLRREKAEATASQLAVMLAHEHADLERERGARHNAEVEARELEARLLARGRPTGRRFGRSR